MKFVDISGFGHSGKSVITDLFKEFEGYQVPEYNFEFILVRIQGGLLDLQHALVDNWSPIRSDAAVRRFMKLIKRIGPSAKFSKPFSLFQASGMNYDDYFNGQFSRLSNNYIHSFVDYIHQVEWPYAIIEEPGYKKFYQRMLSNFQVKHHFSLPVYVATSHDFEGRTRKFLQDLFNCIKEEGARVMVMHNAIEPFNPMPGLSLFNDAKVIVVQRDPRDIYASTFYTTEGFIPKYEIASHWKMKSSFLNTDNIKHFIERQLIYYNNVNKTCDDDKVLRLKYEEIILDYENCLKRIYHFLGEEETVHVRRKAYFKPELSIKNIGLWKNIKDQDSIRSIERSLLEYCYHE